MAQASGGVDDRREGVPERARVERARVDAGRLAQGADPRPRGLAHLHQAAHDQTPVLTDQRYRIGHRRQGDQVELAVGVRPDQARAEPLGEGPHDGEDHAGGRGGVVRHLAEGRVGHEPGRAHPAGEVVIQDDRLDAQLDRAREGVDRRRPAIDADQHRDALVGEPLDRFDPHAVAVGEPARQVGAHVGPRRPQRARQDGGRADAVAVVVTVDRDPLGAAEREHQPVGDPPHPGQRLGRIEGPVGVDELTRQLGRIEPAPDECPREGLRDLKRVAQGADPGIRHPPRDPRHYHCPERRMPNISQTIRKNPKRPGRIARRANPPTVSEVCSRAPTIADETISPNANSARTRRFMLRSMRSTEDAS